MAALQNQSRGTPHFWSLEAWLSSKGLLMLTPGADSQRPWRPWLWKHESWTECLHV